MRKKLAALVYCMAMPTLSYAIDQVETLDGSTLSGTIISITETTIVLSTSYAGELTLERDQIKGFNTDQKLFVRLQNGATVAGQVHHDGDGQLDITGQDNTTTTQTSSIVESWQAKATDPQLLRTEEKQEAQTGKWSYEAALDIVGKKGNSEQFGANVKLAATHESVNDTLTFYGSMDKETQDTKKTANEIIIGSEYTTYYADPWGWYVRGEAERDDFENLELRTMFGGGLSYRVFNEKAHSLELRSGLGYRYENFTDGTQESSPTLDFGLSHKWKFVDWAKMTNHLTYTPAIEDFSDYLLVHDSGINIPIGFSTYWTLRFGLRHDYKSMPAAGRDKLDTSYYSRLQLTW